MYREDTSTLTHSLNLNDPQMSRSDIAHLHMRIVKIERAGQSARILSIHVKRGREMRKLNKLFVIFVSGRN